MANAKKLPDLEARIGALTDLERSMLVEAGAGSGKTSIMAGRVAMLFAQGVEPKHVAAITFTEFAASELMIRITRFVNELARGVVAPDLEIAFPKGVSTEQQNNVDKARRSLDQLVCSTIHGFAQALIKPYPVEAEIDPGAEIIDPTEADLAFGEIYLAWLKGHLSGQTDDDVVAECVLADEGHALGLLRSIADFRRHNRNAYPAAAIWSPAEVEEFIQTVANFRSALAGIGFSESDTEAAAAEFTQLAKTASESGIRSNQPTNRALIAALNSLRPQTCFTRAGSRRKLQTKGKWKRAAAAVGRSKAAGTEAFEISTAWYLACHDAHEAFMTSAAGELLRRVAGAMNGLMADWGSYKRDAALLDFDDLLYTARDLLAGHEQVRLALARRFQHVLVDEFQDTDPLQIEILWRLCGEALENGSVDPLVRPLRPKALFLVGDPKQAIYRFRGADVNAYIHARTAIGDAGPLKITANFRSVEPILRFVNDKFEAALSAAAAQPGFTELLPTCDTGAGMVSFAVLDVADGDDAKADTIRDAEAKRVADLCSRLVGNRPVRGQNGEMRPCRLGDIALLAPVGTELWRFEEALEDEGIAVSTQAGKGFFHRQEIQDLIALVRTLADGRDTLALGALLRGPLIGLTEMELLDVVDGLPSDPDRPNRLPHLNLWTDAEEIRHDLARSVIRTLQTLAKRARATTPYALLSDAIGLLNIRSQLRQRFKTGADRALANTDLFLEMSCAFDVRGLRAFAGDMRSNWEEAVRQVEGRPDAEEQSVALITIHAAKGLEWPIVIPINMTGSPKAESGLMHDRKSDRFSIPVFGIEPPDYAGIKSWNVEELARERVRLWYVAATRARDLLILPRHSSALKDGAFANIVDFDLASIEEIDPEALGKPMPTPPGPPENRQTREQFAEEAMRIVRSHRNIEWRQPSQSEAVGSVEVEGQSIFRSAEAIEEAVEQPAISVTGGATRGTILHKLMEEVLNGETGDGVDALAVRALELMAQLSIAPSDRASGGVSPHELARTVIRTFGIPEIAELRRRLIPEHTIYGSQLVGDSEIIVSGIADAVAYEAEGRVETIVDWKSDVEFDAERLKSYCGQLDAYRRQTRARNALLVLMTPGTTMAL